MGITIFAVLVLSKFFDEITLLYVMLRACAEAAPKHPVQFY